MTAHAEDVAALKEKAREARSLGDIDRALGLYQEAAALARGEGALRSLAHTQRHVGELLRELGRLDESRIACAEAVDIYDSDPEVSPLERANALRPLALTLEARGDWADARLRWRQARQLYRQSGVTPGVNEADAHIAELSEAR